MSAMEIRLVEQTDPDETTPNPGWYTVEDFDDKDAAEIRAGTLVRYTVQVITTDEDGTIRVLGDSLNHVAVPGLAGIWTSPWAIPEQRTYEIVRAAKDELTAASGLEVGDHVAWIGYRPDGAGRLHEVVEIPKDDEGACEGVVKMRQLDAVEGNALRTLRVNTVSKEIGPRKPNAGRDRGGLGEKFRKREGGGFLVYAGDYADQVVMSAHMAGFAYSGWACRSIDEFGEDAWVFGADRAQAIRLHGRRHPNKGVTC
ncbi:hypothetical protein AB0F77_06175 [Streptomyces sp. NPDC026672]|uniref:hypothetical protein n=1 Tax=unclassified Streptomyces TaxID=2593676 RepID=UPI0033CCBCF0